MAAKDKCEHGEWLPWLSENCPEITVRTAQNYMAMYEKGMSKTKLISHLTPTQAYKALGIVKDPTDPVPVETPLTSATLPRAS